jgi:hypothetical protein
MHVTRCGMCAGVGSEAEVEVGLDLEVVLV